MVGPVESFDGAWLRLSVTERMTCRITASPAAVEAGLHRPSSPALSPALVEGDSIAYLTLERTAEGPETEPRFRLGAVGYGPLVRISPSGSVRRSAPGAWLGPPNPWSRPTPRTHRTVTSPTEP
ncbi:hypothetical protein [Streptomyces sp. NPDC001286]